MNHVNLHYYYRVERLRDSDTFEEGDFRIRSLLGVRYVPLIHP